MSRISADAFFVLNVHKTLGLNYSKSIVLSRFIRKIYTTINVMEILNLHNVPLQIVVESIFKNVINQ